MEKVFIDKLSKGEYWVAFIIFFIIVTFNLKSIYEFLLLISSKHENSIRKILSDEYIGKNIKEVLVNELNRITFRKLTGLYVNQIQREKLLDLINKLPDFNLNEIKFIKNYLYFNTQEYTIKINSWSCVRIFGYIIITIFFTSGTISMISYILYSENTNLDTKTILTIIGAMIYSFVLICITLMKILSIYTAYKIRSRLKENASS